MHDLYRWFSVIGWGATVVFLGIIVVVGRRKRRT